MVYMSPQPMAQGHALDGSPAIEAIGLGDLPTWLSKDNGND